MSTRECRQCGKQCNNPIFPCGCYTDENNSVMKRGFHKECLTEFIREHSGKCDICGKNIQYKIKKSFRPNLILFLKCLGITLYQIIVNGLIILGPNLKRQYHEYENKYQLLDSTLKILILLFGPTKSLKNDITGLEFMWVILVFTPILVTKILILTDNHEELNKNNLSRMILLNKFPMVNLIIKIIGIIYVYFKTNQIILDYFSFLLPINFFIVYSLIICFFFIIISTIILTIGGIYEFIKFIKANSFNPLKNIWNNGIIGIFYNREVILDN